MKEKVWILFLLNSFKKHNKRAENPFKQICRGYKFVHHFSTSELSGTHELM